ncbi:MAG: hypothetical protein MJZ27_07200 [Bacteroidales bacterium]|nr:hypothetical protein [Bacteroidales bacterium]
MNKFLSIIIIGLLLGTPEMANAQWKTGGKASKAPLFGGNQYISGSLSGGLSSIYFKSSDSDRKLGGGGSVNVDYNQFLSKNWGFSAGLGVQMSNSTASLDGTFKYDSYDEINKQDFTYIIVMKNWEEHQRCINVEMPLGALFRMPLTQSISLVAGAGLKLYFPFKTKYEVNDGEYETTGYYPETNVTIHDLEHHGFTIDKPRPTGEIATKGLGFSLYYDVSVVAKITPSIYFFGGIYSSIGLSNMAKNHDGAMLNTDRTYKSLMESDVIDKVNLRNIGLRAGVKMPLNLGKNKTYSAPAHSSWGKVIFK